MAVSNSIPANRIVSITPSVLAAGGRALDLSGILLSTSTRIPNGSVLAFANATDVGSYFGPNSTEAEAASVYFLGFDNSNQKPGQLLITHYNVVPSSAFLRGAPLALTLPQLQAVSGSLGCTIDGTPASASTVNLASASSFSAAATLLTTALGSPVSYDSLSGAFVISSTTTGTSSTITYGSGSAASLLGLTQSTGAVISQGAPVSTPYAFMQGVVATTTDWATFTSTFEPSISDKMEFARWTNAQDNDRMYVCWDTDVSVINGPAPTSFGAQVANLNYSGICPVYLDPNDAYFVMGFAASIDFTETNGRATLAFKSQTGLGATITNATQADNLIANGYNFYGAYATANDRFVFMYPGQVSGPFKWADSYLNEIWMSNSFQLNLMVLLTQAKSIPYNLQGYDLIEAACMDTIRQALSFGAIRAGVTLSALQAAQIDSDAGISISGLVQSRGWYFQVQDALPQVRQARGTPPCKFWYTDGQSVQSINLPTVQIQ